MKPHAPRHSAPRAFTLIELLVVIAIIGLLAAILFPVFGRARENGRRAACQSNLKQIGYGLIQYSQDFDETMSADWFGPDTGATEADGTQNGRYKWYDAIYPFVKNEQVFTCPSDNTHIYKNYEKLSVGEVSTNYGSYVINHSNRGCSTSAGCVGGGSGAWTPPVSHPILNQIVRLSQVGNAAGTAWVLDGNGGFSWGQSSGVLNVTTSTDPQTLDSAVARHLGTVDVLWCDGHVKAMKLETLCKPDSTGTYMPAFTIEDD